MRQRKREEFQGGYHDIWDQLDGANLRETVEAEVELYGDVDEREEGCKGDRTG